MKKIVILCAALFMAIGVFAQAPEKMSYQAVVRNSSDALVSNQQVGMQISILQGSPTGTAVYVETQTPTTNANGLVSVEFGNGTVVSGTFASIDWANGSYFIKTETDPTGGTNYTITGTSQMMSVPYALHAKTAETVTGTITETDPVFSAWNKDYNDLTNKPNFQDSINTYGFDGDYNSLTNQPTIPTVPTNVSAFTNDAGYITGYTETDPVFSAWNKDYDDLTNKPNFQDSINTYGFDGDYNSLTNQPTIPAVADGSETKINAGNNITITGNGTSTTPYVINAQGSSNKFYLGQDTLGGIVYYIYIGSDGQQHGLIVSKDETTGQWTGNTLVGADRTEDGVFNTGKMPNSGIKTWAINHGTDWYIPSIDELSILWHNRFHVNKTLRAGGNTLLVYNTAYWSSTEYNAPNAVHFNFGNGYANGVPKAGAFSVRAVRAF